MILRDCINCAARFPRDERRVSYRAAGGEVGPFCVQCDAVLEAARTSLWGAAGVTAARLHRALERLRETVLAVGFLTPDVADDLEVLARLAAALTATPLTPERGR